MKLKSTDLSPEEYYRQVREIFSQHGRQEIADGQIAYMKNRYDFFGMKAATWLGLCKEIHEKNGFPEGENLLELARTCYDDPRREMQYFALETIQKTLKSQPPEFVLFLEELILEKSWWDTVDWLAKLAAIHFKNHPQLMRPTAERWMESGQMWLQRVAITFQRYYKKDTDAEMLFRFVRQVAGSKEFFLQKGAGWALREYSQVNPAAVRAFISETKLSGLTKREGSKYC